MVQKEDCWVVDCPVSQVLGKMFFWWVSVRRVRRVLHRCKAVKPFFDESSLRFSLVFLLLFVD